MRLRLCAASSIIFMAAVLPAFAQTDRKNIVLDRSPAEQVTSPWSDAVLVGNTLYLSGYIGIDLKTGAPPASAKEETRLAMDDLKRTVEAAGMKMDDVVMVHVLGTDLNLFADFNDVYRTYFHNGFPARTFTGSSKLLMGAHFEITGIAIKSGR